jgi:hypothetical protein
MSELDPRLEDFVDFSSLGYLLPSPAPNREPAQMATALQPNAAQIEVEVLQGAGAAHLQIQPELVSPSILDTKMIERLASDILAVGRVDDRLASWTDR